MSRIPAGKIACRDKETCRGAVWHEPTSSAACGATMGTVLGNKNLRAAPPSISVSATCPVHVAESADDTAHETCSCRARASIAA